ncbi:MAG: 4Fe-4S double cluster binding domain-containing protein [Syntrophobacteraceae bacterium]
MASGPKSFPYWLMEWMQANDILVWGAADLRDFSTPRDNTGEGFPFAVSWVVPVSPAIMAEVRKGPSHAYADEYARINRCINETSEKLAAKINREGYRAQPLAASERTDPVGIKGDFPHKTAATRAGLGWIGRHCQLITHKYGSWVRLGTVFTDMELPLGPPSERSFCGKCSRCVDACPAGALKGKAWYPGLPREEILDAEKCDMWKKEHYYEYLNGHICGICSALCPYGLRLLKKSPNK